MKNPLISVVLGTYNRLKFLKLTVDSVRKEVVDLAHEIIIVDGGSDDGTLLWLSQQKDIITIVQHNHGEWDGKPVMRRSWGYFMNLAFKNAQGKYICMISDDCLVVPGAIKNGCAFFDKEQEAGRNVGAVAFYWRDWTDKGAYHVASTLGDKLYVNHGLFLKQALEDVEYINEEQFTFYFADCDLCLKLWQKGYECIPAPDSFIEHYALADIHRRKKNKQQFVEISEQFSSRWAGIFYDPAIRDRGNLYWKDFQDSTNTGALFDNLHVEVMRRRPLYRKIGKKILLGARAIKSFFMRSPDA